MMCISFIVLGLSTALPVQAQDRPLVSIGGHDFHRRLLANGLSAVAVRDESHSASVFMTVGVGNRQETPETTGLAHLVEHAMFSGTETTGTDEHENRVRSWGGESNAFTREDYTLYYDHKVPHAKLETVLAMEADRLLNIAFFEEGTLHERGRLELEERHTYQPSDGRRQQLEAAVFRTHPYRAGLRDDDGLTKAPGLSIDAMRSFYRRYYHPNNVSVVVVAPTPEAETLAAIEAAFGTLPRGPKLEAPAAEAWFEARTETIESKLGRDRVVLTWLIPAMGHADRPALNVLASWLDRQELSGGHSVQASIGSRVDRDLLKLSSSGQGARDALVTLLQRALTTELPKQELADVQQSLADVFENLPLRARPYFSLAGTFGVHEVLGHTGVIQQRKPRIAAVTSKSVQLVARQYLSLERCVTVVFQGTGAASKPLPASVSGLYKAAVEAAEVGDYERALEAYGRMLASKPNKMNTVIYLASRGQVYLEVKDFDSAIADFEAALEVIDYPAVRELLEDTLIRKKAAMRGEFEETGEAPGSK
ncbi:MAG: zinc protease [Planctomycetota bacterium]|jgi:zinc protease